MQRIKLLRNAANARPSALLWRPAPAAGSYLSRGNYFNAGPAQAYYGAQNSRRLSIIKKNYHPHRRFAVRDGAGCAEWSADGFTRRA